MKKKLEGFIIVVSALGSLILSGLLFIKPSTSLSFDSYNLVRAIVFIGLSVFLYIKPYGINFVGPLSKSQTSNEEPVNILIGRVLSIGIALINFLMTFAFYWE